MSPDAAPPPPAIPRYVYISHFGGISIGAITDPTTGAYRVVGDVLAGDVSRLYLAPTGGFLVAARTGALHVFAIDAASGSLTEVDGAGESLAVASVGAAAFSPDGAYLFIGMRDNSLRPYRFDASTGSITQANVAAIVEACR